MISGLGELRFQLSPMLFTLLRKTNGDAPRSSGESSSERVTCHPFRQGLDVNQRPCCGTMDREVPHELR